MQKAMVLQLHGFVENDSKKNREALMAAHGFKTICRIHSSGRARHVSSAAPAPVA
jgi:hypothetical protein